ncbi:hypothetical protein [Glycomyces tarimensis]
MATMYAVKVDQTSPYFDDPDAVQYLADHTDPAIPYRKLRSFPAGDNVALVKREGAGDWEPVNGLDLQCIGMRAKHDIIKKRAMVDGFGWARCTCGWKSVDNYRTGLAHDHFHADAERHMADVDAHIKRFRDLLGCVPHTPEQETCPHANDETREDYTNPAHKEWRCHDCGLYIKYDIALTTPRTWQL